MIVYSYSKAEANLDEVFAKVWSGEEIVITKRGRPVVRITRIDDDNLRLSPAGT